MGPRSVEVWIERTAAAGGDAVDLFILKFPGTGGRAERITSHPAELWPELACEVWAVNPPGYGGSSGRASLKYLAPAARAVYEEMRSLAGNRPILVTGNSLGTTAALHLAAQFDVAGLLLRNPPPLRRLIVGEHGWWNLWAGALLVASCVPSALDSVRNARATTAPTIVVTSAADTIVPPKYQRRIIDALAGERRVFEIPAADHAAPIPNHLLGQYEAHLAWMFDQMWQQQPRMTESCAG